MNWIANAEELWREQQFNLFVPLAQLTKNAEKAEGLQGHSLFVQGSIDLILKTSDGRLILVDYKTDRISEEEAKEPAVLAKRMKQAHGNQLYYYACAVKRLFGKEPDGIYIYSLPLGAAIPI